MIRLHSYNVSSDELEAMRTYLMGEECTEHIKRLIRGDYYFTRPRQAILRKGHSNRRRAVYTWKYGAARGDHVFLYTHLHLSDASDIEI